MLHDVLTNILSNNLSLYFAFIIILVSVPTLIYSLGYMKEYKSTYSITGFYLFMLIFILSMLGVVFSRNSIAFMVFWEVMSISSFLLVIFEHKQSDSISSGIMYFIMTHISGIFLMLMFASLYKYTNSFDFTKITELAASFNAYQRFTVFAFALLGFGAKAGLLPLHVWLPKAHPAAPSNISALMSGVMLKIALYGFIMIIFVILKVLPVSCGIIVLSIGTATAVFSIINAIFQNNIKKLLAFSSIENIGIITATIGLSMLLLSRGFTAVSQLALAAALFHILNHAIFKALLFMSAGCVVYATNTKNMNELGGLHKKMKFAAFCTFIGVLAISAIPPLNGFASEMQIFRSFILAGESLKRLVLVFSVIGCGILIALTSGGALYASVKSFGITFLGSPRSEKAEKTHHIPSTMNVGMGILTFFSLLAGIASPYIMKAVSVITSGILNIDNQIYIDNLSSSIMLTAVILIILTLSALGFDRLINRNKNIEIRETWGCGFNKGKSYMQYSASGLTQPISKIAGSLAAYKKELHIRNTISIKQKVNDMFEILLYKPVIKLINIISELVSKLHQGAIQLYVAYIFITLLAALFIVAYKIWGVS